MRRSFTLLEVVVAASILSLIMLLSVQTLGILKKSESRLQEKSAKMRKTEKMRKLMDEDVMSAKWCESVSHGRFSILSMRTRSSIYGIPSPYVVYVAVQKGKVPFLVRLESAEPIRLPLTKRSGIFATKIADEISTFKTFRKGGLQGVYLNSKNLEVFLLKPCAHRKDRQ